MKKFILLLAICSLLIYHSYGQIFPIFPFPEVELTVSEKDAEIYVNNKLIKKGNATIVVPRKSCVFVKIVKAGYFIEEVKYCKKKYEPKPPKTDYITLTKDDSYWGSVSMDISNKDMTIIVNKKKSETQAWKLISQIIMSYFDIIEISDKETGYLRTAWVVQTYSKATIRTRVIIKQSDSSPLTYKIKIISEKSNEQKASVKDDEKFSKWDRVLRKYEGIVSEIQTRLKK